MRVHIIHYIDDTTEEVKTTMFDQMQAEQYAKAHGWGGATESIISQTTYAVYRAARRENKEHGLQFDDWATQVSYIEEETSEPEDATADHPKHATETTEQPTLPQDTTQTHGAMQA